MISLPLEIKKIEESTNKGTFQIEGLYPNYGITIANALRRILLSSLEGAAITYVKIKDAPHEFSTLTGVYETVLDIILNLKTLRLKMFTDEPQTLTLNVKGEKEILASDIKINSQVEIVNKDLHIATLTDKKAELEMELTIEKGTGYRPAEEVSREKLPVGVILLDSIFSPVTKVNFTVEDMRMKGRVDYNRLIITVETDGTISPNDALKEAANILAQHFAWIADEISEKEIINTEETESTEISKETKIEDLPLSNRTINALTKNSIKTLAGLLKLSNEKLKDMDGLGDKSREEILEFVKKNDLQLKD
jgi:DNA-directed RNA polymerase subunit alpha